MILEKLKKSCILAGRRASRQICTRYRLGQANEVIKTMKSFFGYMMLPKTAGASCKLAWMFDNRASIRDAKALLRSLL
jgi:hypothetical protein